MTLLPNLSIFVNLFAFFGLTIATYTIFYFGRSMSPTKGVSFSFFTLALGVNLIGLSHLFRIWVDSSTSPLIDIILVAGAGFMLVGVPWVFQQNSIEISKLKRRSEEINSVIAKLKDKYYQQELSEEDLKSAYSGLLKELAELEVKLDYMKKKKS